MSTAAATISIFHDLRYKKTGSVYPVKLRVYHNYERRYYPTGYDLSKDDFASTKPRGKLKKDKEKIMAIEAKAKLIKDELKVFSFERFEKKFLIPTGATADVFFRYDQTIENLRSDDRINTASNYEYSKNSLVNFLEYKKRDKTKLTLDDITVDFLKDYNKWMISQEKSETTIGIYLRPLRAIFNQAISEKEIDEEFYPFSTDDKDGKYRIPTGDNIKKALSREDLTKLFLFKTDHECLIKARAFWFFSYSSNGMNVMDIAKLRLSDREGDKVTFIRAKTKRTAKKPQRIEVHLTSLAKEVIEVYGNRNPAGKNDYLFSIINRSMNETQKVRAVQNFTKFINQHMATLAKQAGVKENVSTYSARHSYSTHAITVAGKSMEFVMGSLGHKNMITTQNYFKGFASDAGKEVSNLLMDFSKK